MQGNNWYVTSPEIGQNVKGLVHFINDEPVDSIISKLGETSADSSFMYVFRIARKCARQFTCAGVFTLKKDIEKRIEKIGIESSK